MTSFNGSTALVSLDLLLAKVSRSLSDTPQSVGLLRTSVRPVAETSTWQRTTLTTDRQTDMLPAGLEPTIPACEWPQTHALDLSATGIGIWCLLGLINLLSVLVNMVGIATRYGLEGLGIESRCGRDFPHPSRPALGTTQPLDNGCWVFPRRKAAGAWRWIEAPNYRPG